MVISLTRTTYFYYELFKLALTFYRFAGIF